MASLNERKRKGKGKFFMNAKKAKYAICPGQRGFLGYCNKFERESIKEARILFDEYSLKINKEDQGEEKSDESEVDEFDAADAEQEEMKKQSEQEVDSFQLMNSGVQNVLFFKTKMKDPVKFSQIIMDDIISNGEQKTRFLMRLVPIEATCKAHEQNVTEAMKKLLQKHFSKENVKTYCVVFKSRCNHDFKKEMTYKIVGDIIKELSPESKVEYKTPDFVIMVEVMKSNCCLAVLPKYFDTYKKCNLIELSKVKKVNSEKEIKTEDTKETSDTDQKIESSKSKEKVDINVEIPQETENQS